LANLKLAVGGPFPYRDARDAGVRLGLGTDGPGSNNSLDLFSDMKASSLLQKQAARDPPARIVLRCSAMTGSRSPSGDRRQGTAHVQA
jgi:cytosine/adenosine deaminase-related metal-dependent hydrolase